MMNVRFNKIYQRMNLSMKSKLRFHSVLAVFGFSATLMAQNLAPVANNDNLNAFTNGGANTIDVQANDTDDGQW
jgi:hypothetical protein